SLGLVLLVVLGELVVVEVGVAAGGGLLLAELKEDCGSARDEQQDEYDGKNGCRVEAAVIFRLGVSSRGRRGRRLGFFALAALEVCAAYGAVGVHLARLALDLAVALGLVALILQQHEQVGLVHEV